MEVKILINFRIYKKISEEKHEPKICIRKASFASRKFIIC